MTEDDQLRWDGRHAGAGVAAPAPPAALRGLPATVSVPTAGCALDVACGRGSVAAWLALRGLTVDAVDVSPAGLAATAALTAACGVADRVRGRRHDLDAGLPVDLPGLYDVVVCQRFRDPRIYPSLAARLAPHGLLLVTVLSEVGASAGTFRAPPGELPAAFAALEVLHHRERDGEAHLVARRS